MSKQISEDSPPKWPLRLLRFILKKEYIEEVEGDLEELYHENLALHSRIKARKIYVLEVLRLLRPILTRNLEGTYRLNGYGAMKHYAITAFRSLKTNRGHSYINIMGLSIGLATSIFICQYVLFELSYDDFHEHKSRLYRVEMDRIHNDVLEHRKAASYSAFGPDAKAAIPGIENFARLRIRSGTAMVGKGENQEAFKLKKPAFVDPEFIELFSFGKLEPTLLDNPNSIVLTESTAQKFFGEENAMGEMIFFKHGRSEASLKVVGVIPDVPQNAHIQFEALIPFDAIYPPKDWVSNSWEWAGVITYFLLDHGVDPEIVVSQFPALVEKHKGEKLRARNMKREFSLRPIEDIHLYAALEGELEANGSIQSVYFLVLAVFLILSISWLNAINLTMAKNAIRDKEKLVRRVLGANNRQMFGQLFVEALLANVAALMIALVLLIALSSFANPNSIWQVNLVILERFDFWFMVLCYTLLGSLLLSIDLSFILRKVYDKKQGRLGQLISKFGIVFQFAISLILVMITWTMNTQVNYMSSYVLGFDKNHILVIDKPEIPRALRKGNNAESFKVELENMHSVKAVSSSYTIPGGELGWTGGIRLKSQAKIMGKDFFASSVSGSFIEALGLALLAGDNFDHAAQKEIPQVLLNRTAMNLLGFDKPEEAIQQIFVNSADREFQIRGIVEDFNFQSLRYDIEPIIFRFLPGLHDHLIVNLKKGDVYNQLEALEKKWYASFPSSPFSFFFLDEYVDRQYQKDVHFMNVFLVFTVVGVLLAVLGIFSLVSFYTSRKVKEIGIRKVLGAGLMQILWMLSSQFVYLIAVGICLAIPFSFYVTDLWLADFAYHIEVQWWWYLFSVTFIMFLAWCILYIQTIKAASTNPVECLKNE